MRAARSAPSDSTATRFLSARSSNPSGARWRARLIPWVKHSSAPRPKHRPMRLTLLFLLSFLAGLSAEEKKPCPFCEIVAGSRASAIVYRDGTVLAFMDNAPRNPGHILIIPVAHAENFLEVP